MILPARIDQTRRSRGRIARFVLACVTSLVFSGLNFSSVVHAQAPVEIRLVFGPNVAAAHQEAFRRFVPQVQPFFAKVLGRPKFASATIYVYATQEDRRQAFMQMKSVPAEVADRLGSSAAVASSGEVWYTMDHPCFDSRVHGPGCDFAKIFVHELLHTWQFEFVNPGSARTSLPRWITEGTAEFIGYLGAMEMRTLRREDVDRYIIDSARRRASVFTALSEMNSATGWNAWATVLEGDLYQILALAFFR